MGRKATNRQTVLEPLHENSLAERQGTDAVVAGVLDYIEGIEKQGVFLLFLFSGWMDGWNS